MQERGVEMAPDAVRMAELLAAVSAATDFAKGLPEEQALRTCRAASTLAERAGLDAQDRQAVFYVSLLRFVGCTATAPQMADALGDELAVSELFAVVDPRDLRGVLTAAAELARRDSSSGGARRALQIARFLAAAPAVVREHEVASCEVARMFAARIGLPERVSTALADVFERWDGHGNPGTARGEDIGVAVRVEQVAHAAEVLVRTTGHTAAVDGLRRRAGAWLDPELVELACAELDKLRLDPDDALDQDEVLAAEPRPWLELAGDTLDIALAAIGAVADLKSAYTRGHAAGVATRAAAAAAHAGLPADEVDAVRRAGWLHDLGRLAVSTRVWDRPGPLTGAQLEQVRLHPYVTERVLVRCAPLADVAAIAGAHHERADGTGYHRGTARLGRPAAVLAAADVYQALGEPRPHRPALDPGERARLLAAESSTGRLPAWAVDAVLHCADRPRSGRRGRSDELTVREREVLALIARGATNRAVAAQLGISAKTVNAHLEHVFTKLGVTTRGAAAFYAVEQGLLDA